MMSSYEMETEAAWARGQALLGRWSSLGDDDQNRSTGEVRSVHALVALVRAAVDQARARHSRLRSARIELILPAEIPSAARVRFDGKSLGLALAGLIDRSVSSLGGGIGVVRVRVATTVSVARVTVEDNGCGFSDDMIRRALERGASASPSLRVGGQAVLAVERARRMAHAWGGRAESMARLGAGSRTDFELPRLDHREDGFGSSALAFARQS